MIHIIYCLIIFVLFVAIVFQAKALEFHQKEKVEARETSLKLKSRLHDVINDYRRDRGVEPISWTEFKAHPDPTSISLIPPGSPVRNRPVPRPFGIELKKRPSHSDYSDVRVSARSSSNTSSSSSSSSRYVSDDSSSYSSSSSSSDSSSSCDSGSSSSSSCD